MRKVAQLKEAIRERAEARVRTMPPARRLRFELALETLERELGGAGDLLDAGCGEGLFTAEVAARFPGWSVVGADLEERQLATARASADGLPNVSFLRTDLTEDLALERYDAVVALECLEEIEDDETAIANIAKALRPGGLFVGHVPERDWKPILRTSDPIWRHEVRHGYHAEELAEMLQRAGLHVRRIEPTTHGIVRFTTELRDRIKHSSLKVRMLAYPWMVVAVRLERLGLSWGSPRGLFVEARRK
jgi:2-polyprenyl-3-methyl-5-hydroxy-6-metoxy-1,4-benzoquinol methylase